MSCRRNSLPIVSLWHTLLIFLWLMTQVDTQLFKLSTNLLSKWQNLLILSSLRGGQLKLLKKLASSNFLVAIPKDYHKSHFPISLVHGQFQWRKKVWINARVQAGYAVKTILPSLKFLKICIKTEKKLWFFPPNYMLWCLVSS